MEDRYVVIKMDGYISDPMSQEEAIKRAQEYDKEGVSAYISRMEEINKMRNDRFNMSSLQ